MSSFAPGSPPRSGLPGRKQSIVERASTALEQKFSSSAVRRVATTPASYGSGSGSSRESLAPAPSLADETYSMSAQDYEIGDPVGYGSSAVVYIATYKPTNKFVGIKMIDLDMFERNQIDELRREIQIMSLSRHPHLLPVYGSFVSGSKLFIVTPFLSAGSCLDIMKTAFQDGIDEVSIATILRQALEGLVYLHKNGLIHRDVKAGNLLIHEDGLVQLADFGVSSSLMDTGERKGLRKTFVGTPCWMAPEVMEQSGYDYKADIWSFGITALELATGHAPFAKFPPIKVLMLTLQNEPPTLDRDSTKHKYSKTFKDMIDICLTKDPVKRPTAEKLLGHPFFKQAAKKRSYLVSALLQDLPPITRRPHNRRAQNSSNGSYHKGVSWDFSTAMEERQAAFNSAIKDDGAEQDVNGSSSDGNRGVKFQSEVEVLGGGTTELLGDESIPATGVRPSRFTVDNSMSRSPGTTSNLPGSAPGSTENIAEATLSCATRSLSDSDSAVNTGDASSATSPAASTEVKKGRFSVNQSNANPRPDSAKGGNTTPQDPTLSTERKPSRFAVQTLGTTDSSVNTISSPSDPTRTSDRRGRFEVTQTEDPPQASLETLLKQNEIQRAVLADLISALRRNNLTLEALGVSIPPWILNDSVAQGSATDDPNLQDSTSKAQAEPERTVDASTPSQ